jgi:hypothetical protein
MASESLVFPGVSFPRVSFRIRQRGGRHRRRGTTQHEHHPARHAEHQQRALYTTGLGDVMESTAEHTGVVTGFPRPPRRRVSSPGPFTVALVLGRQQRLPERVRRHGWHTHTHTSYSALEVWKETAGAGVSPGTSTSSWCRSPGERAAVARRPGAALPPPWETRRPAYIQKPRTCPTTLDGSRERGAASRSSIMLRNN